MKILKADWAHWAQGDIIRDTKNHPLLVLHVYKGMGTIVIDMLNPEHMVQTYAVLPRDYSNYTKDEP